MACVMTFSMFGGSWGHGLVIPECTVLLHAVTMISAAFDSWNESN